MIFSRHIYWIILLHVMLILVTSGTGAWLIISQRGFVIGTLLITCSLFQISRLVNKLNSFNQKLRVFFDAIEDKDNKITNKKRSTSRDVSAILKKKGIIRYEAAFLLKLYFSDYKGKLRYGTFDLNNGMSLGKVIKELATQDGQKENKFTIPEGYTIEMTASKLEKEGIMSAQEFLTAVTNAAATSKYKDVLPKKK